MLLMPVFLLGCGEKAAETAVPNAPVSSATLTNDDWGRVVGAPDAHKDTPVELVGKVFQAPEAAGGMVAFQMWADPRNSDWNTIVYGTQGAAVRADDYVRVVGIVGDQFTGENALGAELTVPTIQATSVEIVDALAAAPPAVRTVSVDQRQTQHGVALTLTKVEFAASETRVYLTFANGSRDKASFFSFNAKAVQGSRQYSEDNSAFMTGYPQIESELLPKTRSSGVLIFPEMNPKVATRFVFEASSENWNVTFTPFVFRVK